MKILCVSSLICASAAAQVDLSFYHERVESILADNCLRCHGERRARAGLRLDNGAYMARGGDGGAVLDEADPDASLLLRMVRWTDEDHQMPPDERLSDEDIAVLETWVRGGAPMPEGEVERVTSDWWAYQRFDRPEVPSVSDTTWVRNEVDAFVAHRLEEAGLDPAPEADRRTLIRRATYDLTGLPPTPEAVEAFVNDPSPDAWERLIDDLLDSPHYGERWGRHWLDLVRYADTNSYERDGDKPRAWQYRDYVIRSFNEDKPYDRFLIEQLAGDELPDASLETMIATGYHRLGIWDDEPTDLLQAQYDDYDGIVDTTARVMLGMSIGCARCHSHKKDPISQDDYYRFLAFFHPIKPYKETRGNSLPSTNFLKHVPEDFGSGGYEVELATYNDARHELLDAIREVVIEDESVSEASVLDADRHLVARYRLDGAGPVLVDDHGGHDGRIFDASTGEPGRHGSSLFFEGGDDYATVPRTVQDDFTISFWFRTRGIGHGGSDLRWFVGSGLIDGEVSGIVDDFGISYHSNGRVLAGTGRPETFLGSQPGYNDGDWHHVAMTRHRASGMVRLFVDGELQDEATGSTRSLTAVDTLSIGRMSPGYNHFTGHIDDIRFFDAALDPDAILSLAVGGGLEPSRLASNERLRTIVSELRALTRPVSRDVPVLCVMEREPPVTTVLVRGNAHAPGRPVSPGFPEVLGYDDPEPEPTASTSGRRLSLATWMTRDDHPLTSRVMANRLWHLHFGRGIVRDPNDFGQLSSEVPSHPDLLDWLAKEMIAQGWSMKAMHRILMTSSTYRMSSEASAEAFAIDPRNDLMWRYDMRRLGAEEIRDSILSVNGTLNPKMFGEGIMPPMPEEILATSSRPDAVWQTSPPDEAARRSVYIHVKRSLLLPVLKAFDLADTDSTCPVRFTTTQPTQALTMLNSSFMHEQAALFAERLRLERPEDRDAQVRLAFELVASREPSASEIQRALTLMDDLEGEIADPLQGFCLLALNLNEFVYLD